MLAMHLDVLKTERHGHVWVVALPPAETLAAADVAQAIVDLCQAMADDVRVVLFTGLEALSSSSITPATALGPAAAVARLRLPTVAAIKGDCLDGALELALACDIRVAGPGAQFGMRQVRSGELPADGGTQRLTRLVGRGHALRLLLTGDVIGPEEALRIGLVQVLGGLDQAMALTERIGQAAPIAGRYTKEAVVEGLDLPLAQGLRLEADLSILLQSTADRAEGLRSFREHTPPSYEGR